MAKKTRDGSVAVERPPRANEPWTGWMSRFGFPDLFATLPTDMRIEERREDDHLTVRVEIPGVDPEKDLDVSIVDGTLCIHAERRRESRDEDEHRIRSEFSYGSFTRRVPLPRGATDDDVKAQYRDGILEVTVPVADESPGAKRIAIAKD